MSDDSHRIRQVNIHKTHPALFRAMMTLALTLLALAVNFWLFNPTFNPYGIPHEIIGCIFFLIGAGQVFHLVIHRSLRMVRLTFSLSAGWLIFWGLSNLQNPIVGVASFQLSIIYVALAILHIPLLLEAPVNPMMEKE